MSSSLIPDVGIDPNDGPTIYPAPLSPSLPAVSTEIERNRVVSASLRSSIFSLSPTDVIFNDEWLMVVNKPQGVYCEAVLSSIPRFLHDHFPAPDALHAKVIQPELHLANRLDRDTSGVMMITKSHKVAAKLVKAFTEHKVTKSYLALCVGSSPEWEQITLRSGHGRSKFGIWRVYAASDVGRILPGGSSVRGMETSFELLSVNGKKNSIPTKLMAVKDKMLVAEEKRVDVIEKNNVILVRAYPRSGRTHQIRLHCRYLGIPILGDVKYEGVYEWNGKDHDGHMLHAERLCLQHPVNGLPLVLQAPLPLWAHQALHPLL